MEAELEAMVAGASAELDALELRSLFTGEHDEHDAVCEIHAKDGGTDAQDWAEMMVRMYQRWAERRGFEFEIEDVSEGQEAGILSASFIIRGRYATGLLTLGAGRAPPGSHLTRSTAQARRQTSFASMSVVPFFEDLSGEVDIDEKDLRIDTYRSSGAGGQHVNVTDSAVRITHLPTGTVVAVQNERSQHQNKAKAMQILASKLAELQREARDAELSAMAGPKALVGLGRPDPLLRAGSLPAGQGPAHRLRDRQRAGRPGRRSGPLHGGLPRAGAGPGAGAGITLTGRTRLTSSGDGWSMSGSARAVPSSFLMIKFENVTKSYKGTTVALRDVDVDIQKGEFVFLVGPSGSGQVHLPPSGHQGGAGRRTGRVWVAGKEVGALSPWKVPVPAPQHRLRVPGLPAAADQVGLRERGLRSRGDRPAAQRGPHPGAADPGPGRAGQEARPTCRTSCPAASSSGWPSPGRSSTGR